MSMTKKDYEMVATVLRLNFGDGGEATIVYWLADAFVADNPKFDREKFLKACGVTE